MNRVLISSLTRLSSFLGGKGKKRKEKAFLSKLLYMLPSKALKNIYFTLVILQQKLKKEKNKKD